MHEFDPSGIRGTVIMPDDRSYADASLPWNLAVEQRPAAIVTPVDEDDVRSTVRAARRAGLRIASQPTGHGAHGVLEDVVLVRPTALDSVSIDVGARLATVGGGALVGALMAALDGTGLIGPTGTSRTVSVAGLTLGGGHGWFARLGGLGGQWLRRVRIVDGTGDARWLDDTDAAMAVARGAGGLLGVVTTLEIDLLPVSSLQAATLRFAAADAPAVLEAMVGLESSPAGLGVAGTSVRMPALRSLPAAVRGRSWFEVHSVLADVEPRELRVLRDAAPVLDESVRPILPSAIASITAEPEAPCVSMGTALSLPSLSRAADALCAFHATDPAAPLLGITVRLAAGIPHARPAVARLDAPWLLHAVAPVSAGDGRAQRAALDALEVALRPVSSTHVIPTFLGTEGMLDRALDASALAAARAAHADLGAGTVAPVRLP